MTRYDAVIIGSGQAGNPLARKLAAKKWKVAVVERDEIGGTCINVGCTPTKTLIAAAERLHLVETSGDQGVHAEVKSIDWKAMRKRKDFIVNLFKKSTEKGLKEYDDITVIHGEARFSGKKTLDIFKGEKSADTITADHIFINTGAKTLIPDVEGLSDVPYLTSASIMELDEIPEQLLIMGGGYIALEFGQLFSRLGSKVTVLEMGKHLLVKEDDDVCEVLTDILRKEGLRLETGARVQSAKKGKDGKITLSFEQEGKMRRVSGTHVLVAVGRVPNTGTLNLESTGLKADKKGFIPVNAQLETSVKGIFVLGDAKEGPAFTHVAYNDHLLAYDHIINKKRVNAKNRVIPYCMYTDPQLGRVGLNEVQAKAQGIDIKVAKIPMKNVARAIETNRQNGFMKAVVDARTHHILGATILSADGGEISTALQIAMMGRLKYEDIRFAMFAHPSMMESLNNLFMTLDE
ncbi:MAG: mercuric reductase [Mucilaginibacter polytrichastri]|nr:mercuric reductase [Mucilaginibacter polytrichastri]